MMMYMNNLIKRLKDKLILTNRDVLFCYSQSSKMEKNMSSTALGAEAKKLRKLFFDEAHEKFTDLRKRIGSQNDI